MITIYIHASSMIFSGVRIHCRIFLHRSTVTIVSTTAKITDTHALLATQRRIPLSSFAGEPCQNVGRSFLKSYAAVCLEGAIIVLSCIIFSHFAASPPIVRTDAAAVTMVWSYIGELIFNMLILVGSVKMSDRIVREMMGL